MKSQSRIKELEGVGWYRCKRVEFTSETAIWELSQTGRYGFSESYQKTPHRQLIQATDDNSLRAFVKAWGPLRPSLDAWSGSDPIETYRRERDGLTASVRLLTSVEEPAMERSALLGLSEFSRMDANAQITLRGLRMQFQIPGSMQVGFDEGIHRWLESVTQKQIEAVTEFLISTFVLSLSVPSFTVERNRRGNVLRASLGIHSLADALGWMVWQDVFQDHPIKFCAECRGLIDSTHKYEKKFCSYECAHRQTARESARRKREERKKNNGTPKTR